MKKEMRTQLINELESIDFSELNQGENRIEVYLKDDTSYDINFDLDIAFSYGVGGSIHGQTETVIEGADFKIQILDITKFDQDGDIIDLTEGEYLVIEDTLKK